tara:strand:- start:444 stop:1529 length:1086 start_codon:yes stop_codon:yes gene_type:complete
MDNTTGHRSYCTGHSHTGYLNDTNLENYENNFFAHYDFPFALQKSATTSLKSYGSKINSKPCSLKAVEVIEMVNEKISPETEQVLIGSLLGDGSLQKIGRNAYFRETHSTKQREYLKWKKKHLNELKPRYNETSIFDKRTNKYYHHALLWTTVDPLLTEYHSLMYSEGKKKIGEEILSKIGPLALAVWYCDDGSFGYINQNGKIATYLSYENNKLIAEFLKKKFDINCTINKDGKEYHLYFSVEEIKKFLTLIKDYVPKCMNYKLGSFCKKNFKRLKEENLKRREKDKIRRRRDMNDPIKHTKINKYKKEYLKKRMQNPEFKEKTNEYHRIWNKKYREKNRERYNEYCRKKQREYYWKKKK